METPVNVSQILANLPGGKPDDEPDWLQEFEDDEAPERQESETSDDPFAFISTPNKSPFKGDRQVSTPGEASNPQDNTTSTLKPAPRRSKASARGSSVPAPSRITIKNPDKIIFDRLLVELPHKESDCVDLSGDTGAVGRIAFSNHVHTSEPDRPCANSDRAGVEELLFDEADPSVAQQEATMHDLNNAGQQVNETLILDLKGVKFNAKIASLAGTACVLNIQPNGAKVEAVFNEFVQLEEASLFEDYEEITDGTLEGWNLGAPDDVIPSDGMKPAKKNAKVPIISSGRVSKATKRKGAGKAAKTRPSQKSIRKR